MNGPNYCMHNKMVECAGDYRPCYKCGWNPDVREKRMQKITHPIDLKQKGIKI